MIEFIESYFFHQDKRGSITGLINFGNWKELNFIESRAHCVRGNHYHPDIFEIFIILEGEITVKTQQVINGQLAGDLFENQVKKGDVFLIRPLINHTFLVCRDSRWINVLSDSPANSTQRPTI